MKSSGGFSASSAAAPRSELPTLERPAGIPERFDEHVKLMYELQWLAFRADITRVVTFMLGRELNFRTYPEIGITEGHHGLSHHQDNPDADRQAREAEHLSGGAVRLVPREAASRRPKATARCSIIRCSSTAPGSAIRTCTRTTTCRWWSSAARPVAQGRTSRRVQGRRRR